jgi:hypothetical protein
MPPHVQISCHLAQRASRRGKDHEQRVSTPFLDPIRTRNNYVGISNLRALSVKLSGSRCAISVALPIDMEIHASDCGIKDHETTKPMQSTLALSRHGWLNTVYEINPHASAGAETTGQMPVDDASPT